MDQARAVRAGAWGDLVKVENALCGDGVRRDVLVVAGDGVQGRYHGVARVGKGAVYGALRMVPTMPDYGVDYLFQATTWAAQR